MLMAYGAGQQAATVILLELRVHPVKSPGCTLCAYWRLSGYYFFISPSFGAFSPYFGLYLQSLKFYHLGHRSADVADAADAYFGPNFWGWVPDHFGWRLGVCGLPGPPAWPVFSHFLVDRLPGMLLAMAVLAFFWSAALPWLKH